MNQLTDDIGHVSSASIITLANDLISLGVVSTEIEKILGAPLSYFNDGEARIPLQNLVALEVAAPQLTGDAAVGFSLGRMGDMDGSKTGVVGYIARHSPTLGTAIGQAIRYTNLISDGIKMDLQTEQHAAKFVYIRALPNTYSIVGIEIAMVRMAGTLKMVAGKQARILEANFKHQQPTYLEQYQNVFGESLRFGQEQCTLVFPVEYLAAPIPGAQAYLHEVLAQQADQQMNTLAKRSGLSYQVQRMVLNRMADGKANIETIAADLHISRQTLFRQLKAESTSFQIILDETRKALAADYLLERQFTYLEIAFMLGFSEASTFYRAFKRWYKLTPGEYRENN